MTRGARILAMSAAGAILGLGALQGAEVPAMTVDEIVARHLEARGGAERWRDVESLSAVGEYSAFSFKAPSQLLRRRGDLYRLDFSILEAPAVRARDSRGPWALHKLLWPEPTRLDDSPYRAQLEREALFGPLLLDFAERGLAVESLGRGEVDGIPTLGLAVTFPDGSEETWHLDAETFLEVMVESRVVDFTQASEPVRQRTFFDEFREVDGLVLPHWMEHEFNHRLEGMTVDRWEVDPELPDDAFAFPEAEPAGPEDTAESD